MISIKKEFMMQTTQTMRCHMRIVISTIAIFLTVNLLAVNLSYRESYLTPVDAQSSVSSNTDTRNSLSLPDLFSKVQNSVVQVSDVLRTISGEGTRLGSGFVYDNEGHIITNNHVVQTDSRNAQFDVTFSDGNAYTAQLVGSDPYSDLAVLKLQDVPLNKLVPLSIGNSSEIRVGETVIAIGNPFGLAGSMTTGIVSGLARILPSSNENPSGNSVPLSFSIPNIIQTDAAINPGNSGGPLLNSNGEVVGINSAIFSTTGAYSGVGFAVPSDTINKIVPSLIRTGTYQHPYLGVVGLNITPSFAKQLGLHEARGFLITGITSGGPADKYGLRAASQVTSDTGRATIVGGDIILKIDNQDVKKIDDVLSYLEKQTSVGDTVHLTINRNGAIQEADIVLDARPSPNDVQNIAAIQPNIANSRQSPNGNNDGNDINDDNPYDQCARFAGNDLCGFFFGR
jgi:S1-C subfamily serine protease